MEQNPPIVIYDGQWVDGLKHGKGVYVYSYEPLEYYEGTWENGQKSGLGKYFKDGSEYYGEWSANKRNGQGTYVTKDGSRYNGRWKNDQLEEAVISYPKGTGSDEYRGDVSRGLRNGKGTYTYSDGGRYEGDYRDDLRHGRGKEVAGSAIYEGDFLNDKKHGRGRAILTQEYTGSAMGTYTRATSTRAGSTASTVATNGATIVRLRAASKTTRCGRECTQTVVTRSLAE